MEGSHCGCEVQQCGELKHQRQFGRGSHGIGTGRMTLQKYCIINAVAAMALELGG